MTMIYADQHTAEDGSSTCVRRPCRVYNLWPEHKTFKSVDFNVLRMVDHPNRISLYIQTFANRLAFSVPADSLPAELGYSHLRLGKDIGFWLGNVVVGNSEDGSTVSKGSPVGNVSSIERHQGELDIGIMFPPGQRPATLMVNTAVSMLDIAIPFLATSLAEYFVPITEIQIDEWRGSDRKLVSPQTIRLEVKKRTTVSVAQLGGVFDKFCALMANISTEELQGLAVASRRMSSAILEEDIIDKYCDFWECCEFLAPTGRQVAGIRLPRAKDAAITELLCRYILPSRHARDRVRNKIHECYIVRNDLVHNAVEDPTKVDRNMKFIGEVALQLFRHSVEMPFEITPELASLL